MWPMTISEIADVLGAKILSSTGKVQDHIVGITTDSRRVRSGDLFVPLRGDHFDGIAFVSQAVAIPGVWAMVPQAWSATQATVDTGSYLVVDDVLCAFRSLAAHFRGAAGAPGTPTVVAVGGSNGKTTTKEMIVAMLGGPSPHLVSTYKSENGFVGIPKTLCSPAMTAQVHRLVLEVGIDEMGSMSQHLEIVRPDIALLTSLSHEHLEGLGSFENVVREEMVLMEGPWIRVWQGTDPEIARRALKPAGSPEGLRSGDWFVGEEPPVDSPAGVFVVTFETRVQQDLSQTVRVMVSETLGRAASALPASAAPASVTLRAQMELPLRMPGAHNAANCALACAATLAFVQQESRRQSPRSECDFVAACRKISENFSHFVPPEMRSNLESFRNGSMLLADCYNSNPASLRASLETARLTNFSDHQKFLFLGDMLDLGSSSQQLHADLIFELESMPNCQLYLYGEAMYSVFVKLKERVPLAEVFHLGRDHRPEEWLPSLKRDGRPLFVLVKGSRGMAMERLLPGLREILQQT